MSNNFLLLNLLVVSIITNIYLVRYALRILAEKNNIQKRFNGLPRTTKRNINQFHHLN